MYSFITKDLKMRFYQQTINRTSKYTFKSPINEVIDMIFQGLDKFKNKAK
jgi:hypothetical protein